MLIFANRLANVFSRALILNLYLLITSSVEKYLQRKYQHCHPLIGQCSSVLPGHYSSVLPFSQLMFNASVHGKLGLTNRCYYKLSVSVHKLKLSYCILFSVTTSVLTT